MREIKFRAWSKELKKFILACDMKKQIIPVKETIFGFELVSEFELSQFTGLIDKNGIEIYEGDILSNGYGKAPVIFEYGKFGLKFDNGYLRAIKSRPDFEIIGNIWENPELLR